MEGGYEHHMLLPGQRFCPMEDELLMYYLKPKERFEAERTDDLRRNKDLYFFTKKKKVSAKGSRTYRKVGRGTWKGQDAAKKIYLVDDQNQQQTRTLLGFKKTYTYRNEKPVHHGDWIMYEYELDESQFMNKKQLKQNRYVLCLLRKNDVLPEKKRKRQQEEEQEDEGIEDYVENNDEGDNMEPESVIEEPQEKRQRLVPRTNNVAGASSSEDAYVAAELEQWIDFDQQYYNPHHRH
ncbi:NAC domain-containing protein 86-like [Argentina anserina]|uniref:NAC domain-containing protein 86-like n=1 Tax=Argentina anserina TaxID=57926 RepID=UPI0021766507|nr:NAC domain-containing protein 86-like [Potentilla anserina]